MEDNQSNRILYVDFLKAVGLTGIIIAHVGSPNLLLMLRSFDVPLMVLLSALLAERSYKKYTDAPIRKYFLSRIKRLVIPTWIFLCIYFTVSLVIVHRVREIQYYIASFALTRYGIAYVWIILIYVYVAMLVPLFNKMPLSRKNILIVVFVYLLYELLYLNK